MLSRPTRIVEKFSSSLILVTLRRAVARTCPAKASAASLTAQKSANPPVFLSRIFTWPGSPLAQLQSPFSAASAIIRPREFLLLAMPGHNEKGMRTAIARCLHPYPGKVSDLRELLQGHPRCRPISAASCRCRHYEGLPRCRDRHFRDCRLREQPAWGPALPADRRLAIAPCYPHATFPLPRSGIG